MPAALLLALRPTGIDGAATDTFERIAAAFPARVVAMAHADRSADGERLRTWSHPDAIAGPAAVDPATGSWLAVLGNPTRADLAQTADIQRRLLGEALDDLDALLASLSPPWALVFADRRRGAVHVAADACGLQHLYLREEPGGTAWVSSSLLALGEVLGGTLDHDAAAEWLTGGHFMSERTLLNEIRKVGAGETLRFDAGATTSRRRPVPPDGARGGDAAYRTAFLDALRATPRDEPALGELTGGLDSRLVLAGRIAAGVPTGSWTLGEPGCAELRTVARLRRRLPFDHVAVPVPASAAPRLPELVAEMHALADGEVNALEYSPLLLAFEALAGRRTVSVSGSGGEIARGYYYAAIHGGELDVAALAGKVARATGPLPGALRRDRFPDGLAPLRGALEGIVGASPGTTPERHAEDVYLLGRMQRFAGRNITTTGYFARQSLPFFDNAVVAASLALPRGRKRDGEVVRDAVAAWAPRLASVPLDSGIAVAARSWSAPSTQLRWAVAMGRKVLRRYGGTAGRRVAMIPPDPVPWMAYVQHPALRDYIGDLLPARGSRVHEVVEPVAADRIVQAALAGGDLYPAGLLLTLELSLRRLRA